MNLLLDTHSLIWFLNGDENLSQVARAKIEEPMNTCYVSIASLWEIAVKISLGKLIIDQPFEKLVDLINDNGFEVLPILFEHLSLVSKLQFHHRDPFDRLIVSQAQIENMPIISRDNSFDSYSVVRIW